LSDTDSLIESLDALIDKKKAIKQGAMQELLTGKRRLPGFAKSNGYKQIEVGLIPEDWEIKFVKDFTHSLAGALQALKSLHTGAVTSRG
jgi:type I restriction enzyme S subunit